MIVVGFFDVRMFVAALRSLCDMATDMDFCCTCLGFWGRPWVWMISRIGYQYLFESSESVR